MKINFTVDYEVEIDLDEMVISKEDFQLLSHYAKELILIEWRDKWMNEDIYDVCEVNDNE